MHTHYLFWHNIQVNITMSAYIHVSPPCISMYAQVLHTFIEDVYGGQPILSDWMVECI